MWCMCIGEGLIKQLDPTFDIVGEASFYFPRCAGSTCARWSPRRSEPSGNPCSKPSKNISPV